MAIFNSFLKIALILGIILVIANHFTGGFLFDQLGKIDTSGASDPVACSIGLYVSTPLVDTPFGRLPIMIGSDDIAIMLVGGFLLLGLLYHVLPASRAWPWYKKILPFFLILLLYKIIGWWLLISVEGCYELADEFSSMVEPLLPLFIIIAIYATVMILKNRRR